MNPAQAYLFWEMSSPATIPAKERARASPRDPARDRRTGAWPPRPVQETQRGRGFQPRVTVWPSKKSAGRRPSWAVLRAAQPTAAWKAEARSHSDSPPAQPPRKTILSHLVRERASAATLRSRRSPARTQRPRATAILPAPAADAGARRLRRRPRRSRAARIRSASATGRETASQPRHRQFQRRAIARQDCIETAATTN